MCCVGSGLFCDELITRTEGSYRASVCMSVCDLEMSKTRRSRHELGYWVTGGGGRRKHPKILHKRQIKIAATTWLQKLGANRDKLDKIMTILADTSMLQCFVMYCTIRERASICFLPQNLAPKYKKLNILWRRGETNHVKKPFFDVLLTDHLSIFISVINQLDAQIFLFYNKFISCLYMFRAHVFQTCRSTN